VFHPEKFIYQDDHYIEDYVYKMINSYKMQ
jgi:hypothetical protein